VSSIILDKYLKINFKAQQSYTRYETQRKHKKTKIKRGRKKEVNNILAHGSMISMQLYEKINLHGDSNHQY
jgi:hypothetical protein